jgi:hypothetical protein
MATQKTYKINIDVESKTLGQLENDLAQINDELKDVDRNSEAFKNLSKQAQVLNKEIERTNTQIEGLTIDKKIGAAQGAVTALAGALEVTVGTLGLLGVESEVFGEFEEKALSAIATARGFIDISDGLKQVRDNLKNSTVAAKIFGSTAKKALIATGIGAFVVALGTVVAYWDEITEAISGASKEQKDLLKTQEDSLEASQASYDAISESENVLKLQGKSEREIRQLKIDQLQVTLETLKAQLVNQEEIKKAQIETAERNKTIAQGIIRFVTAPITVALKGVDLLTEKLNKIGLLDDKFVTNLEESFSGGIAGLIFNPEKVEEDGNAAIAETENQLRKTENLIAGFRLKDQEEAAKIREKNQQQNDKDAEKRKKDAQKEIDDEKARVDSIAKILEDYRKKQKDIDAETRVQKLELEEQRKLEDLERLKATEEEKQAIRDFYKAQKDEAEILDEEDRKKKEKEDQERATAAIMEQLDVEYMAAQEKINIKKSVLDAVIGFTNSETAIGKAALVAREILAAKELVINAKAALQKIALEASESGVAVAGGFAKTLAAGFPQNIPLLIGYVAQAAGIVGAIKKAVSSSKKAIGGGASVDVPSISPGGSRGSSAPAPAAPRQFDAPQTFEQTGPTVKAYVVSGDVRSSSEADAKIERRRTID